jgi:hypothetical protein
MGINFPSRPPTGQKFPDPALPNLPVWQWNGTAWVQISGGGGGGSGGAASSITFAPGGNVSATDVQAAIIELDTEKAPIASPTLTGDPKAPTPTAGDNDTSIATTAFVAAAVTAAGSAAQVVRYDIAQTLTTNQKAQARANIDGLKKNYVLNGAMMVSQENGSTAGTATNYYPVDGWVIGAAGTTGTFSLAQVASTTPGGSPNRIRLTVTAADASVGAGDIVHIFQRIEGLRMADLLFGTASAKTITVQFGVKAPAGTYCVAILNAAANRSYVSEYVITAADVIAGDVIKSVTLPGDITGTWNKDNLLGLQISFTVMAGTTFQQAAGAWGAGNVYGSSNQFNLFGTNGNVFELFDVGLYEGNVAPVFQVPDYASELAVCQRYWENNNTPAWSANVTLTFVYKVTKRAQPTVTYSVTPSTPGTIGPLGFFGTHNTTTAFTYTVSARL